MRPGPLYPGVPRTYMTAFDAWTLEEAEGDVTDDAYQPSRTTTWHKRTRYAGPQNDAGGGARVQTGRKVNASGRHAFGGARTWPYVTAELALPADRDDLVPALVEHLKTALDTFARAHHLDHTSGATTDAGLDPTQSRSARPGARPEPRRTGHGAVS